MHDCCFVPDWGSGECMVVTLVLLSLVGGRRNV